MKLKKVKKKFERYINESVNIVGYIDAYGSVHSIEIEPGDGRHHPEIFPGAYIKRWRWSYNRGFSSIYGGFDPEDSEKIRSHLTKKYGIPWYENGYHDVYYMIDIINK